VRGSDGVETATGRVVAPAGVPLVDDAWAQTGRARVIGQGSARHESVGWHADRAGKARASDEGAIIPACRRL
jgi:hypothetical protein